MMDAKLRAEVDAMLPKDPDERRVLALIGMRAVLREGYDPYREVKRLVGRRLGQIRRAARRV